MWRGRAAKPVIGEARRTGDRHRAAREENDHRALGAAVPVTLPAGFTLYPGAKVVSNTLVMDAGTQRALLVMEAPDPLAKVMLFYRSQARAAGAEIIFDFGGNGRASLGGHLPTGASLAISGRREGEMTRVELAFH